MKIEYIYPDPQEEADIDKQIRRMQKENTAGCLISSLFMLITVFIILTLLPVILLILGYAIVILGVYTIYKIYLESWVLNFIQKHKQRR